MTGYSMLRACRDAIPPASSFVASQQPYLMA